MFPKTINIGPATIHLYGVIITVSIYLGWLLAKKRASLYKIPKKIFDDPVLLVPLALAIIGARLYHVADWWDYYLASPGLIFALWRGGLGIWGALIGVLLGFWIISKIRKIDFLSILDLSAPSLLLGQALGRFGNLVNQEAFGPPTDKPWGIFINPENRPLQFKTATHFHPTFFYEVALDGIFAVLLLILAKKLKFRGQLFALYLILYAFGRFVVEFWRIDTWTVGTIKIAQILAVATLVIGFWLFISFAKEKRP